MKYTEILLSLLLLNCLTSFSQKISKPDTLPSFMYQTYIPGTYWENRCICYENDGKRYWPSNSSDSCFTFLIQHKDTLYSYVDSDSTQKNMSIMITKDSLPLSSYKKNGNDWIQYQYDKKGNIEVTRKLGRWPKNEMMKYKEPVFDEYGDLYLIRYYYNLIPLE